MGILRRDSNGALTMHYLDNKSSATISSTYLEQQETEKAVTFGNLVDVLQPNSYSMSSFIEDKKNKSKPMHFIENGPFSSNAPTQDQTYANIPKEEQEILMSVYGDEVSYQYALSLMEFSKDTTPMYNKYVSLVLNTLTNSEHEKYVNYQQKLKQQKEEQQQQKVKQEIDVKQEDANK
jgi:hypothetical protein